MSARIREDDGGLHGLYALPRIVSFTLIDSVAVTSCDLYISSAVYAKFNSPSPDYRYHFVIVFEWTR